MAEKSILHRDFGEILKKNYNLSFFNLLIILISLFIAAFFAGSQFSGVFQLGPQAAMFRTQIGQVRVLNEGGSCGGCYNDMGQLQCSNDNCDRKCSSCPGYQKPAPGGGCNGCYDDKGHLQCNNDDCQTTCSNCSGYQKPAGGAAVGCSGCYNDMGQLQCSNDNCDRKCSSCPGYQKPAPGGGCNGCYDDMGKVQCDIDDCNSLCSKCSGYTQPNPALLPGEPGAPQAGSGGFKDVCGKLYNNNPYKKFDSPAACESFCNDNSEICKKALASLPIPADKAAACKTTDRCGNGGSTCCTNYGQTEDQNPGCGAVHDACIAKCGVVATGNTALCDTSGGSQPAPPYKVPQGHSGCTNPAQCQDPTQGCNGGCCGHCKGGGGGGCNFNPGVCNNYPCQNNDPYCADNGQCKCGS